MARNNMWNPKAELELDTEIEALEIKLEVLESELDFDFELVPELDPEIEALLDELEVELPEIDAPTPRGETEGGRREGVGEKIDIASTITSVMKTINTKTSKETNRHNPPTTFPFAISQELADRIRKDIGEDVRWEQEYIAIPATDQTNGENQ